MYAPLLREDLDRLATILPVRTVQLIWRYRPDSLEWRADSEDPLKPFVVEVRGFEPGKNPEYDRDFEEKVPWLRSLEPWLRFDIDESWRERDDGDCFRRGNWLRPALQPGSFSPAALERWRELLARLTAAFPEARSST
jgi:hypothetical protein